MGSWRCQLHFLITSSYLEASWGHLGPSWGYFGPSRGSSCGHLGAILAGLRAILGHLEATLGLSWGHLLAMLDDIGLISSSI